MNVGCLYGDELGLYAPLEKDARELSLQSGVKNPDVDNSVHLWYGNPVFQD